MKECWSEGDLRAYHDGELLPGDMERVAAHLGECPKCEAVADELAGRAARVAKLMAALPEPRQVMWLPRAPVRTARVWQRWTAAAVGLAACLAIVIWLAPRGREPEASIPQATARPAVILPTGPAVAPQVSQERAPLRPVAARRKPKRSVKDVFLALDDEPIETGVVVRVALGEAEIPADVVFGKDGRPRAIRLVSNLSKY